MAEWCGVENSARETKRRRGAHGGGRTKWGEGRRGCQGGHPAIEERGRAGRKGERELPGRNKLARNERQIASELSARSPDVIEAAMLLPLHRLRSFFVSVSRFAPFRPSRSLSPIFAYVRLILVPLSFSFSARRSSSFFPSSLAGGPVPEG